MLKILASLALLGMAVLLDEWLAHARLDRFLDSRGIDPGRYEALIGELCREPHPHGAPSGNRAFRKLDSLLRSRKVRVDTLAGESISLLRDILVLSAPRNLVGSIPATSAGDAPGVALVAHYDASETSFGCNDNAAAVGAVLAALDEAGARPERPFRLYAIFTDGEESGLLGGRLVSPWLRENGIDYLFNFEARGAGGWSVIFQSLGDGGSLPAFIDAPIPVVSDNILLSAYKSLPNMTDMDAFTDPGWKPRLALNSAYFGDGFAYHNKLDDFGSLNSTGWRHHLAYGLHTVDRAARADAIRPRLTAPADEETFFGNLGLNLNFSLSAERTRLIGLGLVLAALLHGIRSRRRSPPWRIPLELFQLLLSVLPFAALLKGLSFLSEHMALHHLSVLLYAGAFPLLAAYHHARRAGPDRPRLTPVLIPPVALLLTAALITGSSWTLFLCAVLAALLLRDWVAGNVRGPRIRNALEILILLAAAFYAQSLFRHFFNLGGLKAPLLLLAIGGAVLLPPFVDWLEARGPSPIALFPGRLRGRAGLAAAMVAFAAFAWAFKDPWGDFQGGRNEEFLREAAPIPEEVEASLFIREEGGWMRMRSQPEGSGETPYLRTLHFHAPVRIRAGSSEHSARSLRLFASTRQEPSFQIPEDGFHLVVRDSAGEDPGTGRRYAHFAFHRPPAGGYRTYSITHTKRRIP